MTDRPGLTRKQAQILGVIKRLIKEHGTTPSYREIARAYGNEMNSLSAVHTAVRVLIKRGYLIADYNSAGRICRNSLAIAKPGASVKVLIRPDGTLIRTEQSGAVDVRVQTVFPEVRI